MVRRSARLSTAGAGLKRQRLEPSPDEPPKRPKVAAAWSRRLDEPLLHRRLFCPSTSAATDAQPCLPPARLHSADYHRPILLDAAEHRRSLLAWFDSVAGSRAMPWRKPWIDPALCDDPLELRRALEVRAYEVWISEVMLQQTRVAVVVDYWRRWMARWPTMRDLARADADDVLAAWRGLGYYSRATRIHQAAKLIVDDPDMRGLLPADAVDLAARVPGVGRYTAGAISAIVFGQPEPMVDGNVLRLLSRQLGIYANVKTDRAVIDTLWAAADALVKAIARPDQDDEPSASARLTDRPGRWGQALMELGSTVCTPKPDCAACPITSTCRVYKESEAFSRGLGAQQQMDMEDVCGLCLPFEESLARDGPLLREASDKQPSLAAFAFGAKDGGKASSRQGARVADYARRFPAKVAKKAVREEETVVCAIRHPDGSYLVQRRPAKGLLAGLWELPSAAAGGPGATTAEARVRLARSLAATLLTGSDADVVHVGELGSVPWLFSHIKLTMHVHVLATARGDLAGGETPTRRWSHRVDAESMGTGMRKCWALVRDAQGSD